ncbi:MAG: YqgE/AlgH family protein [Thermaurantiacus sp.]
MHAPYLSGQYLLAMPGIGDPRFENSVIAMCAHDPAGALGICVHAEIEDLTVPDLMRQLELDPGQTPETPVLMGGPVEPQRGFVLHTPDWGGQDTMFVAGRWALTGTLDVLRAIAGGEGPRRWLVALGYAGWGEGQLDAELARHGWFSTEGTDRLLWETDSNRRWAQGFALSGVEVGLLSATAGRA